MNKALYFLLLVIPFNSIAQGDLNLRKYDSTKVYSQKFLDSLAYDNASGQLRGAVRVSAFKKALESNTNLKGWIYYYAGMSSVLYREEKLDSVMIYADSALYTYENLKDKRDLDEYLLSRAYRNKATVLEHYKQYDDAILNYQKSIDIDRKYGYKWLTYSYSGLGAIHLASGNLNEAMKYYELASRDSLYMSFNKNSIIVHTRLGAINSEMGNYEESKRYFLRALKESKSSNFKNNLSSINGNLGFLLKRENKLDSARVFFENAANDFADNQFSNSNGDDYNSLYKAELLILNEDYYSAISVLEPIKEKLDSLKIKQFDDVNLNETVVQSLIEAYSSIGQGKKVADLFRNNLKSLKGDFEDRLNQKVIDLEFAYQSELKDNSISQLEKVNTDQRIILNKQKTINYIMTFMVLLLFFSGFLFIRYYRQKALYKSINLEQRLLRSQLNPHFLFNSLSTISYLAESKSDKTVKYISKLGSLLRSILVNSREDFITMKEEISTLEHYLDLQSEFSNKFIYTIKIDKDIDREEILIPPMFIQPFVENAIIHGFRGEKDEMINIEIKPWKDSNCINVIIENNGISYSKSISRKTVTSKKSISRDILSERLKIYSKLLKVKASYTTEDLIEKELGTKINLVLPFIVDN